ncbi:MAG: response regulator transcription factor [Candidatus Liptonbacteria bacterium]
MKILIVEDDRRIAAFLKESLVAERFTVDVVHDGERGSYFARTNEYDIIILDNILPGKSGTDICRELRFAGKSVPIIMLTVQSEVTRKIEAFNLGADDYLVKPFALEELLARVRALLRRPQGIVEDVMEVGDLRLDARAYLATRAGKPLLLTKKEFELLEYLMRNKGRVVTRGMIMEHVWDMNADPFSNTIETHILNLRRKIEGKREHKLISTIAGRGYRMEVA